MCEVLDRIENRGLQRGMQQGIQQGIQQGMQQGIQQGIQQGMQQGIQQGMLRGRQEGETNARLANISSLMKNTGWSAGQAMDALSIPVPEQAKYLAMLEQ